MTQFESSIVDRAIAVLDAFQIEIPSWGFANTGTRFGKFFQPAAATTIEEKFADAAEVNRLTGATPTIALHVLVGSAQWDWRRGGGERARAPLRDPLRINQPKSVSGSGVQVWIAVQSIGRYAQPGTASRSGFDRDRQGAGLAGRFAVAARWLELSRVAEHSQADRLA